MAAIPVLVPPSSGVLVKPYVTAAMFRAFPTWQDTDNLIQGAASGVQDDALADVLLQASDWAVGVTEDMPLHGHLVSGENLRAPMKSGGRVHVRPEHIPVRAVTSLSWGCDPSSMEAVPLPDSTMWLEDGRRMSWRPGGGLSFSGPAIQFGPRAGVAQQVYVTWSYVAGFPSALLAAPVSPAAMSITVDDPAGILPNDVLRCYDPGKTEAFTVASTYVPAVPTIPATQTSIPLAAAVVNSHATGTGVTGMPRKVLQAVIAYGVALLLREDVSEEEPASPFGPSARTTAGARGGAGAGLVNDAIGWLRPYAPTLRS